MLACDINRDAGVNALAPDLHYLRYLAALGAVNIHPGGASATRVLLESLRLRPGHWVLELGCGPGLTMQRVAQYGAYVVGIDVLPEMVRSAVARTRGRHGDHCRVASARAERLPFCAASFDRVVAESVLGIQDGGRIRMALAEIFRVLKPGGIGVINDAIWRPEATSEEIQTVNAVCEMTFGLRQACADPWRLDDWLRAMRQSGLEVSSHARIADLLKDYPAARSERALAMLSRAARRLKMAVVSRAPALERARRHYARGLRRYAAFGRLIEARLFVVRRP